MAPRPRVDTHPPYAPENTFGPEAVELAAAAGLILDHWQADALHTMLAFNPDTSKWLCFEYCELVSRQNGKGAILEARALAGLFLLGEQLIIWSAHEVKTAMRGFRRFLWLIKQLGTKVNPKDDNLWDVDGRLVKVSHQNGEEGFELLDTGQQLLFIARSKGSGRGFSGDLNIIDEAFAYTNEQHSALLPTVSARPNGQFLYTSSPPLDGITGPVLYRLRERGDPDAPRKAGAAPWQPPQRLAFRDWGAAGDLESLDSIDLADRALWVATNPSLGHGRLTIEDIENEYESMLPVDFARERLGIWPRKVETSEDGGVIDPELWKAMVTTAGASGRPAEVAFAVVVAADRSHTTIAAVGPQNDGLMQASIVAYLPGTAKVVDRMEQLQERWNPVGWAVQDKGPTASLWPEIEKRMDADGNRVFREADDKEAPHRGHLAVPWANDVAAAYGLLMDAIKDADGPQLRHLGDVPLNAAAAGAQPRNLPGGGTTWDYRSPVDISPIQGVTLAYWLFKTRAHLVVEDRAPNLW